MQADGQHGRPYKADDSVNWKIGEGDDVHVNEVSWSAVNEPPECSLEWARETYGASRPMPPGPNWPLWTPCVRGVTQGLDAGQIVENRGADEITRRERRRLFKG